MCDKPGTNFKETSDAASKIKEILIANGITEPVSEVIIKDAGLQGEGFASKTEYITVKFTDSTVKPLNLFAKVHSQSESHTEMLDDVKAFEKEGRFLTEYVTEAKRLWKAKGCEGDFDLYPKCYYGDSKMIIMENLVLDKGYCLLSKADRQDLQATKFALTTLAKHHAVSYAMIQEAGGPENFFKKFPNLDFEAFDTPHFIDMMGPMFVSSLSSHIGILENNNVEGKDDGLAFLKHFRNENLMQLVLGTLNCDESDLKLLGHGDYWNNNMMFLKDARTNVVIGHKAIDLQVTRYNTPALDLTYYMFTSVQTDVRIAHFKELLEFYLDILNKVASDLRHPINLTYEQLFSQYQKRLDYGFWCGMCMAVGPGVQAMKGFDVNTTDIKDWPIVWDRMMKKWMVENPEKAQLIAEEVVKYAREYKTIMSH